MTAQADYHFDPGALHKRSRRPKPQDVLKPEFPECGKVCRELASRQLMRFQPPR